MAKAPAKPTSTTWVWLREIYPDILNEICGSPQSCGPWLAAEIAAGRVRWQAKKTCPPDEPLDEFWQDSPPSVDFAACSATKLAVLPSGAGAVGPYSITLEGLQVAREDIERLIAPVEFSDVQVEDAPAAPIGPSRQASMAEVERFVSSLVENWESDKPQPDENELLDLAETTLNAKVSRDQQLRPAIKKTKWARGPGRPRKQNSRK